MQIINNQLIMIKNNFTISTMHYMVLIFIYIFAIQTTWYRIIIGYEYLKK